MYIEMIIHTDEVVGLEALGSAKINMTKISVKRILQTRLVLDPGQAKHISVWLMNQVKEYESKYGEIVPVTGKKSKGDADYVQ